MLLEVIVQSEADARAAADGGADRLEVVRDIDQDGLTPSIDVVRAIRSNTRLPLRIMIRDRNDFSAPDRQRLERLQQAIRSFADLGVDGAVVGFARGAELDLDATAAVLSVVPSLRATFHRAFDVAAEPARALDALRTLPQIDRVLTTGGGGNWAVRCQRLQQYAELAGEHLTILAGGGVDENAVRMLRSVAGLREVHVGRAARVSGAALAPVSVERVRRLKAIASSPHAQ